MILGYSVSDEEIDNEESLLCEEQIIDILKEYRAGLSASELCLNHGVSDATFYKWRSKYGGMEVSEAVV
ncbi:transposase [uncultured Cohaesibacter sp.]|uniref:transposase n=1 Tax=uncultured Cohaesibacter sp. TaxID=1002546 RepID=UPI00374880DD